MKIRKSELVRIVREELARHVATLLEADGVKLVDAEGDDDAGKGDKKHASAKGQGPKRDDKPIPQKGKQPPPAGKKDPDGEPKELPADEPDDVEDEEDVTGGKIADEVTGKTIQSITMEPKSKLMPGAIEIVLTFQQIPDPLRIFVTKTGDVKFMLKGLHNTL